MERCDVIVVGAGPAGSTAARLCAAGGLSTLLLEKEILPRPKLCAGGVTATAAAQLGIPFPGSLVEREYRSVRVRCWGTESMVRLEQPLMYTVMRSAFDQYLVRKAVEAGAELRQGEPCRRVDQGPAGAVVRTARGRYAAGLVIGADGVLSTVRRSLPGAVPPRLNFCLEADIPLPGEVIEKNHPDLLVHYGFAGGGYAWIFPRRGSLSAGIGVWERRDGRLPGLFRDFLEQNGLPPDVRFRGGFVPGFRTGTPLAHGRVILAGDAAGCADSFSGEGIRYAVLSGRAAAHAAVEAFRSGDFSPRLNRSYQEHCMDMFGKDLELSARITDLLRGRPRLILGTLARNQAALREYLQTAAGTRDLGAYLRRLRRRLLLLYLKGLLAPR